MPNSPNNLMRLARRLADLPAGFARGTYRGMPYGVSIERQPVTGRTKLFARELGGNDVVSFNLYRTAAGKLHLRPCEMSSAKVMDFVEGFVQASPGSAAGIATLEGGTHEQSTE